MSKPSRNSDPEAIVAGTRTFFVTSSAAGGRHLLQSERSALLLIDVFRHYTLEKKMRIHEFVVMPTHMHLLVTVDGEMTIEKAVQLIKGNFSYRAKKELGYTHEIWQRGFSEVRVFDRESYFDRKKYIEENPVKAGLACSADEFPYCSAFLRKTRAAAAKAG